MVVVFGDISIFPGSTGWRDTRNVEMCDYRSLVWGSVERNNINYNNL